MRSAHPRGAASHCVRRGWRGRTYMSTKPSFVVILGCAFSVSERACLHLSPVCIMNRLGWGEGGVQRKRESESTRAIAEAVPQEQEDTGIGGRGGNVDYSGGQQAGDYGECGGGMGAVEEHRSHTLSARSKLFVGKGRRAAPGGCSVLTSMSNLAPVRQAELALPARASRTRSWRESAILGTVVMCVASHRIPSLDLAIAKARKGKWTVGLKAQNGVCACTPGLLDRTRSCGGDRSRARAGRRARRCRGWWPKAPLPTSPGERRKPALALVCGPVPVRPNLP